jgi:hypothetical protein
LRIAESHDVKIVTSLDESVTSQMRLKKIDATAVTDIAKNKNARGYVLPLGAKFHIRDRST